MRPTTLPREPERDLPAPRARDLPRSHDPALPIRRTPTAIFFGFSGALIALSILGLVVGGLNYSIDFDGGAKIQFPLRGRCQRGRHSGGDVRCGPRGRRVQIVGGDQVAIRTESLAEAGDSDALLRRLAPIRWAST